MSWKEGSVLVVYPGLAGAAVGDVVGMVAVQGVPDDHQAHGEHAERDGALDRLLEVVAGLPDTQRPFGGLDRHLNLPSRMHL
jgi:hypothetical protein